MDNERKIAIVINLMLVVALILLLLVIIISPTDASSETTTHKKVVVNDKELKIKDKSDNQDTVTIKLLHNTENCANDCEAILEFNVNKKTKNILDNVNIKKQQNKNNKNKESWESKNSLNYDIKLWVYENKAWSQKTLNNLNTIIENKGVYKVKITGSKGSFETVDWFLNLLNGIDTKEWAIWDTTFVYDEINDSSINYNLWVNTTPSSSSPTNYATVSETSSRITVEADSDSGVYRNISIQTINLTNFNSIGNLSFASQSLISTGLGSTTANVTWTVFGNKIIDYDGSDAPILEDSTWELVRNRTSGSSNFDVYKDGLWTQSITATNNILKIYVYANNNGIEQLSRGSIHYIYYSLYPNMTEVLLNSPTNNSIISSYPILFNCSANPKDVELNITKISLYIDNLPSYVQNYTSENIQFLSYNQNLSLGDHVAYCSSHDTFFGITNSSINTFNVPQFVALGHNYTQYSNKNSLVEGEDSDFNITIYMNGYSTTTAKLRYNGILYDADSYSVNGDYVTFLKTLNIPSGTGTNGGSSINWNWEYSISGLTTDYNTLNQTQTVYSININSSCSGSDDIILNFTLRDEESDTLMNISLNPIIKVDVTLRSLNNLNSWTFSHTYNNNTAQVCIPTYILNSTSLKMDAVASYEANGYAREFWYIDNGTLTLNNQNLDSYTIRNVILRDLPIVDSTTFLFKFYDSNYLQQPNAIVTILRNYIGEGVFKEIERAKQDDNGETHIHLVQEDVIYQFRITLNGQLLYLSDSYNAKCLQTPCSITLQQGEGVPVIPTEWDNLAEGTYSISSNELNRTIKVIYNLNQTGIMNFSVFEYNYDTQTETLLDSDSAIAKSGSLEVYVTPSVGNKTFYTKLTHNGQYVTTDYVNFSEKGFAYFGYLGLFMAILLILTLGLIALSQGVWTIVFILIGLIVSVIAGFLDMSFYLIAWITSAGLILIIKLSSRRGG